MTTFEKAREALNLVCVTAEAMNLPAPVSVLVRADMPLDVELPTADAVVAWADMTGAIVQTFQHTEDRDRVELVFKVDLAYVSMVCHAPLMSAVAS